MAKIYDHNKKEWVNINTASDISIRDLTNSFSGAVNVEEALQYVAKDLSQDRNDIVECQKALTEHTELIDWILLNGGGGTGTGSGSSAPTITSRISEGNYVVEKGKDVILPIYFQSPNLGDGVLIIAMDGVEVDSKTIKQGNNNINIGIMKNLSTKVSVYAKDRTGQLSNPLEWNIISGGIDLTLDFDYNVDYTVGSTIYMPFDIYSPNNDPVELTVTIDGEVRKVKCNQGYNEYLFEDLGVGVHSVTLQASDGTYNSQLISFNLIIVDSASLYLSTTFENGCEIEYGIPVVIDYRISNASDEVMTVNQYLNGELYRTLRAKRGAYSWTLNNLDIQPHTYKIEVLTETDSRSIEGSFEIIQGDYTPLSINTQGLAYRLYAGDRTNQDSDRENPVFNGISATLHDFNFSANGWVDGVLRCNGGSYVEIDYSPWADNAVNGSTIEIDFKTTNMGDNKARVLDYRDVATNKGIHIDLEESKMNSIANENKVFVNADEWTTMSFVIDRKNKFAKIFINGVCTRAFKLTDSGLGVGAVLEDFAFNGKIYLNASKDLTNKGICDIKDFRVYRRVLTDDEIVKNVIAQETNLLKQKELYDFNFDNKTLPVIRMYGDTSNMTLETPVTMRIKYTSPNTEKYGQPFDLPYCQVNWQGTSSLDYVLKNYNIALKDSNMADAYYSPYPNGVPENIFCLKADYMESSHSRNVGIAKFVEACLYDTKNPAQVKQGNIRNSVEGFPTLLYINDELQGVYNFNTDRKSVNTFGYNDPNKHLVYEISANSDTTAGAFIKWQPFVQGKLRYYKSSISNNNTFNNDNGLLTQYIKVEPGSKITFNPGTEWTSNSMELLLYQSMDNVRRGQIKKGEGFAIPNDINYIRLNVWQSFTNVPTTININGKDYILIETEASGIETEYKDNEGSSKTELDYYKSDFTCIYPPTRVAGNDNFAEIKRVVEWVHDASDEDFKDNLDQYFNREYLIRYYLFVMMFGAVDSLGKNMKLASWDGRIWYPQVYDCDTTIGLDNTGFLKFDSDIEVGDTGVFNTTSSNLWTKVRILLADEIKAQYAQMRLGKFTLENLYKYIIEEQMDKIPSTFYNKDMQTKYLDFGSSYLYALHGRGEQQIKTWLSDRLLYLDTLLGYNVSTSDYVTIRSSKLGEVFLDVQTFKSMYFSVKWRNATDNSTTQTLKVKKGETVRFSFDMPTATDQEIRVYGGKYIKSLGDLSNLQPTTLLLANAPGITELVCHSENLINTDLSDCTNLKRVDLRDCTQLGSGVGAQVTVDVSKCTNIEYVNCQNTQITSVQVNPLGSNIREIWYPKTVQEISVRECPNLTTMGLEEGHNCKTINLINCPKIEHFGDREYNPITQTYKYENSKWLNGLQDIHIQNSCYSFTSWDMDECVGLHSINLIDMPNISSMTLGITNKMKPNVTSGANFTEYYDYDYIQQADDISITTTRCPNLKDLTITAHDRHSSIVPKGQLYNESFHCFEANTFDISNTIFERVNLLCTCDINKFKVPSTLKSLIVDSYYDISDNYFDKRYIGTQPRDSAGYMMNAYMSCCGYDNFLGSLGNFFIQNQTTKFPASNHGSTIWKVWCPDNCEEPSNLVSEDGSVLAYTWDLQGLDFEDLYLSRLNTRFICNTYLATGVPSGYNMKYVNKSQFYKIQIQNLDIKCRNKPLITAPGVFYQDMPYKNCKVDYSKLTNNRYWSYALAFFNDEEVEFIMPKSLELNEGEYPYMEGTLYGIKTNKLKWNDDFVSTVIRESNGCQISLNNITLAEQEDYETDGINIKWETENLTSSNDSHRTLLAYQYVHARFWFSNLKYIKNFETPNMTNIANLFGRDANANEMDGTESNLVKVGRVYAPKCTQAQGLFCSIRSLEEVGLIEVTTEEGKSTNINSLFTGLHQRLADNIKYVKVKGNINNLERAFYQLHQKTEPVTVDVSEVTLCDCPLSIAFAGGTIFTDDIVLKGSVTNLNSAFNSSVFNNIDLTGVTFAENINCNSMAAHSTINTIVGLDNINSSSFGAMFRNAKVTGDIVISGSIAGTMAEAFYFTSCANLDLSGLDMSKVDNCQHTWREIICDIITLNDSMSSNVDYSVVMNNAFANCGANEVKGMFEYIPKLCPNAQSMFYNTSANFDRLPKFREGSTCTLMTSMYQQFKGDASKIPNPFIVPEGCQITTYMFDGVDFSGIDFVFDMSNVVNSICDVYQVTFQQTFISAKFKSLKIVLPQNLYWNKIGTPISQANRPIMNNTFSGCKIQDSLEIDASVFKTDILTFTGIYGVSWDNIHLKGVNFNLWNSFTFTNPSMGVIGDFTVAEACNKRDIDIRTWRMEKDKTSKFIDEALAPLNEKSLIKSWTKISDNGYRSNTFNANGKPFTTQFPATGITGGAMVNATTNGRDNNYWSRRDTTTNRYTGVAGQWWNNQDSYIELYVDPNIIPDVETLNRMTAYMQFYTMLNEDLGETGAFTPRTLLVSKYITKNNSVELTKNEKEELILQANNKGWNMTIA